MGSEPRDATIVWTPVKNQSIAAHLAGFRDRLALLLSIGTNSLRDLCLEIDLEWPRIPPIHRFHQHAFERVCSARNPIVVVENNGQRDECSLLSRRHSES